MWKKEGVGYFRSQFLLFFEKPLREVTEANSTKSLTGAVGFHLRFKSYTSRKFC
jgi:hypothetical protein